MTIEQPVITGALLGLGLAILAGPVFFALLQTSIREGFKSGFYMAIGIAASDATYIFCINALLATMINMEDLTFWIGTLGGPVLMIIGVLTYLRPPADPETGQDLGKLPFLRMVSRGFLLNFAHPGVFLFWLAAITTMNSELGYDESQRTTHYSVGLITILLTDMVKAFLASRIRHLLTRKILLWLNRIMGIALFGIGLYVLIHTLAEA